MLPITRNDGLSAKKTRVATATITSTIVSVLLSGTSQLAYAQSDVDNSSTGNVGIEEVIVTARKREESVQDAPIAITAFSGDQLEQRNLTNLSEVGAFVPNVGMNQSASSCGCGSGIQIYIRGVGQSDFLFTTDPGVGIYIDGVYHPRTLGGVMDLLDLEGVEVLRGPQGTLFGKNTIGGAISLTSQKPTGESGGYAQVTLGRYNRLDARASFDFPISDKLAAKVSISSKNRDGLGKLLEFGTDKVIGETGDENVTAARAAFLWQASDNVTVDFIADYVRERENGIANVLLFNDDAGEYGGLAGLWNFLVGGPGGLLWNSQFITGDRYDSYLGGPNRNTLDAYGLNVTVNWEISDTLSFKSVTAYREMDGAFSSDSDASPLQYAETDNVQDQNQFSQEFQLNGSGADGRLNWVTGLFYFDEFGRDVNEVRLVSGLYNALEALPGLIPGTPFGGAGNPFNALLDLDLDVYNEIDIKSYAAFAQGSFDITDKLSVTAGIRYTSEKKDYTLEHWRHNAGVPTISLRTESAKWDSFTPMASIDYRWSDAVLTYASISRGFKSGGFNGRPIIAAQVDSFNPEKVTAYEMGIKSDLFENKVRLNIAAFYSEYSDLQLGSISADETGNLVLRIQNAGKAEIKGFEAELQARPSSNFDLIATLGYTDFQIIELDPGVQEITLDSKQIKTPEWNASIGAQYTWNIGEAAGLSLRGDWSYQSSTFQDVQNSPQIKVAAYGVFNARMTYENHNGDWELSVFATNLTDKNYITNAFQTLSSFGFATGQYGRPREWGLTVKKRF